jgi:tetratricopeptide (TPR) repeat protein
MHGSANTSDPLKEIVEEARALEGQGRARAASARYASAALVLIKKSDYPEARRMVRRAIVLSPESPRLYLRLAHCYAGMANVGRAKESVLKFTRLTLKQKKIEAYRPYLEVELRHYPALRQVFYEEVLTIDRTSGEIFIALGNALREQGQLPEAQSALVDALRTKSEGAQGIEALEKIFIEREWQEGLVHLQRFTEGALSREDLIVLLSDSENLMLVPEIRTGHVDIKEKDLKTMITELEVEIGLVETGYDKVAPLVKEFRERSAPVIAGDSKAILDLALAFFEMGLPRDCEDELRKISSGDPLFLQAQILIGEVRLLEGSELGALEIYQACLRAEEASEAIKTEAHYRLVQIYFRLGDLAQAVVHLKELEKKAPNYRDLRTLKSQIQSALATEESLDEVRRDR